MKTVLLASSELVGDPRLKKKDVVDDVVVGEVVVVREVVDVFEASEVDVELVVVEFWLDWMDVEEFEGFEEVDEELVVVSEIEG